LSVPPMVSVPALSTTLAVWVTVVASVNALIVWEVPELKVAPSATSTCARLPSAVVPLELNVPELITNFVPATRLVAAVASVNVAEPVLVMVRRRAAVVERAQGQRRGRSRPGIKHIEDGASGKRCRAESEICRTAGGACTSRNRQALRSYAQSSQRMRNTGAGSRLIRQNRGISSDRCIVGIHT